LVAKPPACLLIWILKNLCIPVKTFLAGGGYRGEIIEWAKNTFGYVIQVVLRSKVFSLYINVGQQKEPFRGLTITEGFVETVN
jgi:hypothetical protein